MAKKEEHGASLQRYLDKQAALVRQKPGESLEKYYRRLAKVADQRLVRLEAYAHDEHYKNVLSWAYAGAKDSIKHWSGPDATRFNTAPPDDQKRLMSKIKDIQRFLESATSTKQGIIEVYKKRADAFNETNETDFTWEELATFFERKGNDLLGTSYGSETKFKAIGVIKDMDPGVIKDAIQKESADHLKLSNDDEVNAQVRKFIEQNGDDLLKLFPEIAKAKTPETPEEPT